MTFSGWLQVIIFMVLLLGITVVLGSYMHRVFTGQRVLLARLLGPLERTIYRTIGVDQQSDQDWKQYAVSLIVFSLAGWVLLYVILRTQTIHPFYTAGYHSMPWDVALNTTTSFLTNTNWQYYSGETTLTYFSQMAGLTVQNFASAAVGICVVIALIRGIVSRSGKGIGNFWQDLVRCVLYILLPFSIIGALVLVSQGVIQTLSGTLTIHTLTGLTSHIALGPVASQEAIKNIGTNGGGFFNVNAAHPFENPNGFTNFLEALSQFSIPAALTFTFGRYVGRQRQGWTIFAVMTVMFLAGFAVVYGAEVRGTPAQHAAGVNSARVEASAGVAGAAGGNMEGKEQRFGIPASSLFVTTATDTSTGAVDSAFDSLTGLGGTVPMSNLGTGEVIFGGVGSGLYMMLMYILLAVFIGGLMVGRTPEYLGKKIEAREIKLTSLALLTTPLAALATTGLAIADHAGRVSIFNSGPQGFSETLYAYLSQSNNNGSAFAGYTGFIQPTPGNVGSHGITFANLLGSFDLAFARYVPIIFVLAVAGSLAGKRVAPVGLGTMRTDNVTFGVLLIGIVILVGALAFFPALMLGPVVNALTGNLF
jgi:potassium-transporting ATPase potassium-binding subunit